MKIRKDTAEFLFKIIFLICGIAAVFCVLAISIYLLISGIPAILEIGLKDFLFGTVWKSEKSQFGILPFILTSIYGTAGAMVLMLITLLLNLSAARITGKIKDR